jgi:ATP-binding cassette subfamily B protein
MGHVLVLLGIVAAVGCSLGAQFAIRNLIDALPTGRAHPALALERHSHGRQPT